MIIKGTLFNQLHQAGPVDMRSIRSNLGGAVPGTLRQFAVFPEHGLVAAPTTLTFDEAGTLSCAAVTGKLQMSRRIDMVSLAAN